MHSVKRVDNCSEMWVIKTFQMKGNNQNNYYWQVRYLALWNMDLAICNVTLFDNAHLSLWIRCKYLKVKKQTYQSIYGFNKTRDESPTSNGYLLSKVAKTNQTLCIYNKQYKCRKKENSTFDIYTALTNRSINTSMRTCSTNTIVLLSAGIKVLPLVLLFYGQTDKVICNYLAYLSLQDSFRLFVILMWALKRE